MALHKMTLRTAIASLGIVAAMLSNAQVARGQYTFVQDSDGGGNWSDVANWLDGGSNTTYPNGVGVTALINQPMTTAVGGYTLTMPATDVTVGTFTIDNTNDDYLVKLTMANSGGRLVFEDPSGTAKWIETLNTPDAPQNVQNTIGMPILVKNTLEFTENNYPNLNTGTIFQNRFDGDANSKIVKKGIGGIQFNLNSAPGAGLGFFGTIEIQEGAIRLINKTFSIATASGITVSNGGQLQLADNANTAVPTYNMATGAVLNLNGVGTNAPSSGPQGALRFGIQGGRTTTFQNPVVLQTDSVISVGAVNSIGVIDQPVTGAGSLTKQGDGKLTITNAASGWGGDTTILSGPTTGISTLSLSNPILANGKDLHTSATRTALDLNFSGIDTIRSAFLDGTPLAVGLYGAVGSSDPTDIEVAWITGTGQLNVSTQGVVGLPGDFNSDGKVDAGDYVTWRKNNGTNNALANDNGLGTPIGPNHYTLWRNNFGNPPGSGSSLQAGAVPEPATLVLLLFIAPLIGKRTLGRTR